MTKPLAWTLLCLCTFILLAAWGSALLLVLLGLRAPAASVSPLQWLLLLPVLGANSALCALGIRAALRALRRGAARDEGAR